MKEKKIYISPHIDMASLYAIDVLTGSAQEIWQNDDFGEEGL